MAAAEAVGRTLTADVGIGVRIGHTVGRISRRRNPTWNLPCALFHVGLRCANPTYGVPIGSELARSSTPCFFVDSGLNRSRMRTSALSRVGEPGPLNLQDDLRLPEQVKPLPLHPHRELLSGMDTLSRDGPPDGHALALTAGELARVASEQRLDLQGRGHLPHAPGDLVLRSQRQPLHYVVRQRTIGDDQ